MSMSTPEQSTAPSPVHLFAYPFRIFFLSLAVLAVLVIPLWVGILSGHFSLPLAMPALYWHQHEMVFAFLNAAIAGFLLTAVCVWTGTQRTHGLALFGLWLVWLLGRVVITFGEPLPEWLVQGINLAFLPLVMLDAGLRVWRARQSRQIMILVVLALLWAMQIGFLRHPQGPFAEGALLMAATLMLIIGGRITPNFSMGWLRGQGRSVDGITTLPWLERAVLAGMLATFAAWLAAPPALTGVIAAVTGLLALLRIALWRGWRVRDEPLLWILHLSLLWIPLGLWLLAGAQAGWWASTVWIHAIGVGAMGGLILGVISRVVLGHTGRDLTLPRGMASAFVMIHLATIIRIGSAMEWLPWQAGMYLSTLLWVLAFGLFVLRYSGMLVRPRVDGKPG